MDYSNDADVCRSRQAGGSTRNGVTLRYRGAAVELDGASLQEFLERAFSKMSGALGNGPATRSVDDRRSDTSSSSSSSAVCPVMGRDEGLLPRFPAVTGDLSSSSADMDAACDRPVARRCRSSTVKSCCRRRTADYVPVASPVGVFWDIENVQVPRGKCAVNIVKAFRERLLAGYREAEFMCVCDVNKETARVVQELNDASVNVVHVPATCKNAADDKLRQEMRRFADYYHYGFGVGGNLPTPAKIVLISRDVNFAPDLSDFRHRRGMKIVLVCNSPVPKALLVTAHEHFLFSDIVEGVPDRVFEPCDEHILTKVHVTGLPWNQRRELVQQKLKQLSSNCGGRVDYVHGDFAVISFQTRMAAARACKRLNGAVVFGNEIVAEVPDAEKPSASSAVKGSVNVSVTCWTAEDLISIDPLPNLSKPPPKYDLLTSPDQRGRSSLPTPICPEIDPFAGLEGFPVAGPLINLEFEDVTTMTSKESTVVTPRKEDSISKRRKSRDALAGNSAENVVLTDGLSSVEVASTECANGQSMTMKGRVCTVNGHADWLRAQLHGKDPDDDALHLEEDGSGKKAVADIVPHGSPTSTTDSNASNCDGDQCSLKNAVIKTQKSPNTKQTGRRLSVNQLSPTKDATLRSSTPYRNTAKPQNVNHGAYAVNGVTNGQSPHFGFGHGRRSAGGGGDYAPSSGTESETDRRCSSGATSGMNSSDESSPVWLIITNLESGRDVHYVRTLLLSHLREHVEVCGLNLHPHGFGSYSATVKLKSLQDQQLVISNLQRKKIGNKRILISHPNQREAPPLEIMRAQVTALLKDVPGARLPLFKFRELFENRYNGGTVSIADLSHMSDVVTIDDDQLTGRSVCLKFSWKDRNGSSKPVAGARDGTPNKSLFSRGFSCEDKLSGAESSDGATLKDWNLSGGLVVPPTAFCFSHAPPEFCRNGSSVGWAEKATSLPPLPHVNISLKVLGPRVHSLLQTHDGVLPLASLPMCYEHQFNVSIHGGSTVGVHLEHLVTCIQGVRLVNIPGGYKHLKWLENNAEAACVTPMTPLPMNGSVSEDSRRTPSDTLGGSQNADTLQSQLYMFSREIVDLLRTAPRCMLPFGKFIPAYHHHFGRQCRVSDYGFTKLIDLFNALPHVVQIMGEGQRRVVTLTHAAQVRRFLSELLRIVKGQPSMQLALNDFAAQYQKLNFKQFEVFDYGVCCVADLLADLPDSVIKVEVQDDDTVISVPKREQTPVEVERTRQFAVEVLELLKNLPHCRMSFNKFIPAYHHLFGKQCRVANYGFSKLMELFEAIPDVVEVIESPDEDDILAQGGEKMIRLVETERLKVFEEQILQLVKQTRGKGVLLASVSDTFAQNFGYTLDPTEYGAASVDEVIASLRHVKVVESRDGPVVVSVNRGALHFMGLRVRSVLVGEPTCKMNISSFIKEYKDRFDVSCSMEVIRRDLFDVVEVEGDNQNGTIGLSPLQVFGRDVQALVRDYGGRLLVANFERAYLKKFGLSCVPSNFGHASLNNLLHAVPEYVFFKGRAQHRTICVSRELSGPLTSPTRNSGGESSSSPSPEKDRGYGGFNGLKTPNKFSASGNGGRRGNQNGSVHNHSHNQTRFEAPRFSNHKLGFSRPPPPLVTQTFRNSGCAVAEQSYVNTDVVAIMRKGLRSSDGRDRFRSTEGARDGAPKSDEVYSSSWTNSAFADSPACPAPVAAPDPAELPDPTKLWAL